MDDVKVVERLLPVVAPRLPGIVCGEGMTKQAHKNECDINKIVARARKVGGLDVSLADRRGVFGDVSNIRSFADVQNRLIDANDAFMRLPAATRKKFDNKVINMVTYLDGLADTEEAIKEAVELGLVPKSVYDAKVKARADAEAKAEAEAAAQ